MSNDNLKNIIYNACAVSGHSPFLDRIKPRLLFEYANIKAERDWDHTAAIIAPIVNMFSKTNIGVNELNPITAYNAKKQMVDEYKHPEKYASDIKPDSKVSSSQISADAWFDMLREKNADNR